MFKFNSVQDLNKKDEEYDDLKTLKQTIEVLLEKIAKLENNAMIEQQRQSNLNLSNYDEIDVENYAGSSQRFSGSSQKLEALKILKTLIPYDLNDQFVNQFVAQLFRSIQCYFPGLHDPEIIELIILHLPKKLSGSFGALRSCKNQKDFTRQLCLLVHDQKGGITSISTFLKFEPKNIRNLGFQEVVMSIVNNAQTLIMFDEL